MMTREEAKKWLSKLYARADITDDYGDMEDMQPYEEAVSIAIKALEQEPVLDKIKAEILDEAEHAYADFERYKVEYLGQDWEDVYDSLPQDDYRYGLERAVEIINKHGAGSEVGNEKHEEVSVP